MNFLCPQCSVAVVARDGSHVTCPGCGFVIDLAAADTHVGGAGLRLEQDLSGEELGPYVLEAPLGAGGMGTVYRARHKELGQLVAIKLLYPQLALQAEVLERFVREASALAQLDHPRIVRFLERGESDGRPYLVMEYVAGQTLEAYVKERSLSANEALQIVCNIAEALQAAHGRGIVHRDLKPANVILTDSGAKVVDFGIAHVGALDLTLTHSNAVLGSLNYMAPEQRLRAKDVDGRADIFAAGVIFYRLLTGTLPIGSFEPVQELRPGLSRRFDAVIGQMLQRDPARRQPDAGTLLKQLAALSHRPRRALRYGVAAAVLVALAAAAWITHSRFFGDEPPRANNPVASSAASPSTTAKIVEAKDTVTSIAQTPVATDTQDSSSNEPPQARKETAPKQVAPMRTSRKKQAAKPALVGGFKERLGFGTASKTSGPAPKKVIVEKNSIDTSTSEVKTGK